MPVLAIIGAQFGSEGKGKVAAFLSSRAQHSVRTGGPNAGHTVVSGAETFVFRHVPCAAVNSACKLYLGPGAIIDLDVLQNELRQFPSVASRLKISPVAATILPSDLQSETGIQTRIGSTAKGVGAALLRKISRDGSATLARDYAELQGFLSDVPLELSQALILNETILLEGTQGTGLSLHHGDYPFVTSRDVTVGSLCAEAGVSPKSLSEVWLVVRPYPIRVAGNSGPMSKEIDWKTIQQRSGSSADLTEYTTVTKKIRRVSEFSLEQVQRSVYLNGATNIALMFADHLDSSVYGKTKFHEMPSKVRHFAQRIEEATNVPVSLVSTGPDTLQFVERHEDW